MAKSQGPAPDGSDDGGPTGTTGARRLAESYVDRADPDSEAERYELEATF